MTNKTAWTPGLTAAQSATLASFIRAGYVAHFYPRKKTIAINGFPGIPVSQAIERMQSILSRLPVTT